MVIFIKKNYSPKLYCPKLEFTGARVTQFTITKQRWRSERPAVRGRQSAIKLIKWNEKRKRWRGADDLAHYQPIRSAAVSGGANPAVWVRRTLARWRGRCWSVL